MEDNARKFFGALAVLTLLFTATYTSAADPSCFYCGMKKSAYGHSWMIINYGDHSTGEFCSLHCACIDMLLHSEKKAMTVLVSDYFTKKIIDADKAHWVIGGSRPGVMTVNAKWAFETKPASERYIKEFGGEAADFDAAIKAAMVDMYKDMMLIGKERKVKRTRMMEGVR